MVDPLSRNATLSLLRRAEVSDVLRAIALFERCRMFSKDEAEAWRLAVRAKAAELADPVARA